MIPSLFLPLLIAIALIAVLLVALIRSKPTRQQVVMIVPRLGSDVAVPTAWRKRTASTQETRHERI